MTVRMISATFILKLLLQQVRPLSRSHITGSPVHRDPVFTPDAAVLTNAFRTPSSFPFSTSGLLFIVRLVLLGSAIPLFRRICGICVIPPPPGLSSLDRTGVLRRPPPPPVLGFL